MRLLANTNALAEFLPEALSSFLAAHPHVSVDLEERLSDEIVGLIAEGVGDVGIVAGTVDIGRAADLPVPLGPVRGGDQRRPPLAARPASAFAEVLAHDFVGLERSSSLQRFLAAKAAREGRTLRLRVQLRSFDDVCRLVECGVGVGVVPKTTAARAAKTMAPASSSSPTTGRSASCASACGALKDCGPTRGNWWRICGRRSGRLDLGSRASHRGRVCAGSRGRIPLSRHALGKAVEGFGREPFSRTGEGQG